MAETGKDQAPQESMGIIEASQLKLLEPAELRFFKHGADLRCEVKDDRCLLKAVVSRCFPLSKPLTYFTLRDGDRKEVGVIVEPAKLDEASRKLVFEDLERRYFVPVIEKVRVARELFGVVNWEVDTSKGPCKFTTRNLRENMVRPSPDRIMITDVDGNRYDIPAFSKLDALSQARLLAQM